MERNASTALISAHIVLIRKAQPTFKGMTGVPDKDWTTVLRLLQLPPDVMSVGQLRVRLLMDRLTALIARGEDINRLAALTVREDVAQQPPTLIKKAALEAVAPCGVDTGGRSGEPTTLDEKEMEYAAARERIMGSARPACNDATWRSTGHSGTVAAVRGGGGGHRVWRKVEPRVAACPVSHEDLNPFEGKSVSEAAALGVAMDPAVTGVILRGQRMGDVPPAMVAPQRGGGARWAARGLPSALPAHRDQRRQQQQQQQQQEGRGERSVAARETGRSRSPTDLLSLTDRCLRFISVRLSYGFPLGPGLLQFVTTRHNTMDEDLFDKLAEAAAQFQLENFRNGSGAPDLGPLCLSQPKAVRRRVTMQLPRRFFMVLKAIWARDPGCLEKLLDMCNEVRPDLNAMLMQTSPSPLVLLEFMAPSLPSSVSPPPPPPPAKKQPQAKRHSSPPTKRPPPPKAKQAVVSKSKRGAPVHGGRPRVDVDAAGRIIRHNTPTA
ncbi:unnamed protein product [Vitrella brassicaformis CCMP3155]|uniref:SUZ domain-containing protein n=1 Tax=Vitrella brassicaformis (strain CCMP3155) TaxID=1169540 RepID=A0A0G4FNE1_VITBC|nr:unnamed protein product [Vitrella brassicaformis CCMP3155]|eukprot:CEM15535.1 unnamed protein product [Vitrella brassicaformis CCMP3155]